MTRVSRIQHRHQPSLSEQPQETGLATRLRSILKKSTPPAKPCLDLSSEDKENTDPIKPAKTSRKIKFSTRRLNKVKIIPSGEHPQYLWRSKKDKDKAEHSLIKEIIPRLGNHPDKEIDEAIREVTRELCQPTKEEIERFKIPLTDGQLRYNLRSARPS